MKLQRKTAKAEHRIVLMQSLRTDSVGESARTTLEREKEKQQLAEQEDADEPSRQWWLWTRTPPAREALLRSIDGKLGGTLAATGRCGVRVRR